MKIAKKNFSLRKKKKKKSSGEKNVVAAMAPIMEEEGAAEDMCVGSTHERGTAYTKAKEEPDATVENVAAAKVDADVKLAVPKDEQLEAKDTTPVRASKKKSAKIMQALEVAKEKRDATIEKAAAAKVGGDVKSAVPNDKQLEAKDTTPVLARKNKSAMTKQASEVAKEKRGATIEKAAAAKVGGDVKLAVPKDEQLEAKDTTPVLAHNDKSAVTKQASEVAKEKRGATIEKAAAAKVGGDVKSAVPNDEQLETKDTAPVLAHRNKSAMTKQASEVAKEKRDATIEKAAAVKVGGDVKLAVPNDEQLEAKDTTPVLARKSKSAVTKQASEVAKEKRGATIEKAAAAKVGGEVKSAVPNDEQLEAKDTTPVLARKSKSAVTKQASEVAKEKRGATIEKAAAAKVGGDVKSAVPNDKQLETKDTAPVRARKNKSAVAKQASEVAKEKRDAPIEKAVAAKVGGDMKSAVPKDKQLEAKNTTPVRARKTKSAMSKLASKVAKKKRDAAVEKAAAAKVGGDVKSAVPNDKQLEMKDTAPVRARKTKSAMTKQASEVAKEEASGTQSTSMLGDMEVTLKALEPKNEKGEPSPPVAANSPTSHFELDVFNAMHRQKSLKQYSTSLMDDEKSISSEGDLTGRNLEGSFVPEEHDGMSVASEPHFPQKKGKAGNDNLSVASEPSLTQNNDVDDGLLAASVAGEDDSFVSDAVSCAGWSCVSDAVSTRMEARTEARKKNKVEDDEFTQFVDDILHPITSATDFLFCKMKCAFPKAVGNVDEVLSTELHHFAFPFEDTEGVKDEASTQLEEGSSQLEERGRDNRGVGCVQQDEVEMVLKRYLDTDGEGGVGLDEEEVEVDEEIKNMQVVRVGNGEGAIGKEVTYEELLKGERKSEEGNQGEGGEKSDEGGIGEEGKDEEGKDEEEKGEEGKDEEGKDEELVQGGQKSEGDEQGERRSRSDEGEVDEEVKDDQLVIEEEWSEEVGLIFEGQLENVAYCPGKGGVVRRVAMLPHLTEDEVLIRVDATTISYRDCLERLRRDKNKELFEELWVPGHEIVGRVVRAGTNSKSFLGKRIAALLPSGGGCSQYVRIKTKDAIELPKKAGSNEVIALLSTYIAAHQCLESVIEACRMVDGVGDDGSESMAMIDDGSESMAMTDDGSESMAAMTYDGSESVAKSDDGQKNNFVSTATILSPFRMARNFFWSKDEKIPGPLDGKHVMIYGAGNPAGLALVDLARNAGATVYAVSSRAHLNTIRDLGAYSWYGLNQRTVWESKWRGTFDAVIDTVGDSHNHPSFFKVMKTRGRFARLNTTSCGQKYAEKMERNVWFGGYKELSRYDQRVFNDKTIDDYDIFHSIKKDKDLIEEDLAHLFQLLQAGSIKPKIVSHVGFDGLEKEWLNKLADGTSGVVIVHPGANDDVIYYVES